MKTKKRMKSELDVSEKDLTDSYVFMYMENYNEVLPCDTHVVLLVFTRNR